MIDTEIRDLDIRQVPERTEYYEINKDGSLVSSSVPHADVYIDEFQIHRLLDADVMKYIRKTHGTRIGVMREVVFPVHPQKHRTTKMLLGVVKDVGK